MLESIHESLSLFADDAWVDFIQTVTLASIKFELLSMVAHQQVRASFIKALFSYFHFVSGKPVISRGRILRPWQQRRSFCDVQLRSTQYSLL
jgi:hypothetical protein